MASNSNVAAMSSLRTAPVYRAWARLIENLDDIRNIVVGEHNGTPVFLRIWHRQNR